MRFGVLLVLGVAAPVWAQGTYCEEVADSDFSALRSAAEECGTLSKGIAAVADWCFDRQGQWTGGNSAVYSPVGKPPPSEPGGDCARAIAFCQEARQVTDAHFQTHNLNEGALDMMRQRRFGKQFPLRPDLANAPEVWFSCDSHDQAALRTAAANRMAIAKRHLAIAEEHVRWKSWVWSESLLCKNGQLEADRQKRQREEEERRKQAEEQRRREEEQRLANQRQQQDALDKQRAEQARLAAARKDPKSWTTIDPGGSGAGDPYRLRPGAAGNSAPTRVDPSVAAAQARAAEAERRVRVQQEQARQAFADGEAHRARAAEMIRTGNGDAINETLQGQLSNIRGTALQRGHGQAAAQISNSQARLATTQAAVGAGISLAGGLIQGIVRARAAAAERQRLAEERAEQRAEAQRLAAIEQKRAEELERRAQAELARAQEEARVARHLAVAATLKTDAPSASVSSSAPAPLELRPIVAPTPAAATPTAPAPSSTPSATSGIVLRPLEPTPPAARTMLITAPAGCRIVSRGRALTVTSNQPLVLPDEVFDLSLRADCDAELRVLETGRETPLVVTPLRRGRQTSVAIPRHDP